MGQATLSNKRARQAQKADDFWLVYSSDNSGTSLSDTLHALYYLPENYRLIVLSDDKMKDQLHFMGHFGLKNRIKLTSKTETSEKTSPFLIADAVVTGDVSNKTDKPRIVISNDLDCAIDGSCEEGFTVSAGNPPAVASAILKIAYAA